MKPGSRPTSTGTAADFLPTRRTILSLRRAAAGCRGCPLWAVGTQTVFGEGSRSPALMIVGEQPGDQEDVSGHPFVGPSGRLLDSALESAGIDPKTIYVTNAVKHFKWVPDPRGKRRIHKTPSTSEQRACHPWLDAELARAGFATVHPSSILRSPGPDRAEAEHAFVSDLTKVATYLARQSG